MLHISSALLPPATFWQISELIFQHDVRGEMDGSWFRDYSFHVSGNSKQNESSVTPQ